MELIGISRARGKIQKGPENPNHLNNNEELKTNQFYKNRIFDVNFLAKTRFKSMEDRVNSIGSDDGERMEKIS